MFRKKYKSKIALNLAKGDVVCLDGCRAKVETIVNSPDGKHIGVTYRLPMEKQHRYHYWRDDIMLYSPKMKRVRYGLLFWLAKKLGAPIKRG